jgi:hypothetical protein
VLIGIQQNRETSHSAYAPNSGALNICKAASLPPLTRRRVSLQATASTLPECTSRFARGSGERKSHMRTAPSCDPVATTCSQPGRQEMHDIPTEGERYALRACKL